MTARNTKGFSIVEVVLVLAVLILIGVIGWRVWDANQSTGTEQLDTPRADSAPKVESNEDLDKANSVLDDTNLEGEEAKQLEAETNF